MTMIEQRSKSQGDRAVDGLIQGVISGLVMILVLAATSLVNGRPLGDLVGYFSPAGDGGPVLGLLTHLAVSSIYGLVFSLTAGRIRSARARFAGGVVYGLLLALIGYTLLIPGMDSSLSVLSAFELLTAHTGYGVTLGWLAARNQG